MQETNPELQSYSIQIVLISSSTLLGFYTLISIVSTAILQKSETFLPRRGLILTFITEIIQHTTFFCPADFGIDWGAYQIN
jgi:hypothetical protein